MKKYISKPIRFTAAALVLIFAFVAFYTIILRRGEDKNFLITGNAGAPVPLAEKPQSLTLVMAGDLLLHRYVQKSGLAPDGSYDFSHLFAKIKGEVSGADIAIVNQETPLAGEAFGLSGYPLFNAPCEVADAIAAAGFDVVLQATNHALDRGADGLKFCRKYWAESFPSVKIAGTAATKEEASEICVVERNGIRVAVLNYTYGTNGIPIPKNMPWIVNMLDEEKIRRDTAAAREMADFVVVCPHWGTEYSLTPSDEQRRLCEIFLECGVDLVIGTHPHVIQPMEWFEDNEGKRMLVYYSLGNFVNSTAEQGIGVSCRMLGALAKVTLTKSADGKTGISEAAALPLITHLSDGYAGITTYLFSDYTEELALKNLPVISRDPCFSYAYCKQVFREVFGGEE